MDPSEIPVPIMRELSKGHTRKGGSWWHRIGSTPDFIPTTSARTSSARSVLSESGAAARSLALPSATAFASAAQESSAAAGLPEVSAALLPDPQSSGVAMLDDETAAESSHFHIMHEPLPALPAAVTAHAPGDNAAMHDSDAAPQRFSDSLDI